MRGEFAFEFKHADFMASVPGGIRHPTVKLLCENGVKLGLTLIPTWSRTFPLSVRGRPGALALQMPQPTNQDWRPSYPRRVHEATFPLPGSARWAKTLAFISPKSQNERCVAKAWKPTFGPRKSSRSTGPVGEMTMGLWL